MSADMGSRIRELRISYGLNIDQLSERLEVSPSFLGLVERGARGMSVPNMIRLSEIFHVSLDYLMTGSETKFHSVDGDTLLFFTEGLSQREIQALINLARTISAFNYSEDEMKLLAEAILFQASFMYKAKGNSVIRD